MPEFKKHCEKLYTLRAFEIGDIVRLEFMVTRLNNKWTVFLTMESPHDGILAEQYLAEFAEIEAAKGYCRNQYYHAVRGFELHTAEMQAIEDYYNYAEE